MRVRAPEGGAIAQAPADASLVSLNGARATISSEREGERAIVVRRSFRIPRMRTPAAQNPAFARFCRAADEAESAEVTM